MDIDETIYEEVVRLLSTNMSIPYVPEGTDPIIGSVILNTPIEFNLSDLCKILELPNEVEHYFLTYMIVWPLIVTIHLKSILQLLLLVKTKNLYSIQTKF